jgi:RNA polymerase sigma-70 factor (ECF subfamily)
MDRAGGTLRRNEALEALLRTSSARGMRIAQALLRSRAEAEDAVQEALARACQEFARLRDPAALDGWFYRVLTNVCMRAQRRGRVLRGWRRLLGQSETPSLEQAGDVLLPDEELSRRQRLRLLQRRVHELPPMQRTVLILRYGQELPIFEIAEMLGVGAGTVKTHLTRGLARLREKMES